MPRYSYLLFDADNTLFDFDAANRNAFHAVCRQCDIPDTDETFALYERCNNAMWAAFDRGECTKDFLVVERFRHFLETMALDRDPALCNRIHLTALGESTLLLSHAEEACRTLSRTHRLYIVTNAVASVQRSRLRRSAVAPYITDAFISEDAGASKPSRAYFDYVFAHIPGITRENCLPPRRRPAGRPPHRLPHHRPAPALRYRLTLTQKARKHRFRAFSYNWKSSCRSSSVSSFAGRGGTRFRGS